MLALALWKLRLVLGLLFFAFIISAAMRPSIEWLARHRVPRAAALGVHYLGLLGVVVVALAFAVPAALHQVNHALSPSGKAEIARAAQNSSGVKHQVLLALRKRLEHLPRERSSSGPLTQVGVTAFEVMIGISSPRGGCVLDLRARQDGRRRLLAAPSTEAQTVRDTWDLIDAKLGAFVRGQVLLILLVGTVLSLLFWAIGVPYWLLVGAFAGLVEIVPVIGPLPPARSRSRVGFTASVTSQCSPA